ncbi:MAG: hypothetical protein SWH61_02380 [Thermodesulfobacteriota bacterium]|nr:hypothetical protein [Thermodesulfobacteriota bacterium]
MKVLQQLEVGILIGMLTCAVAHAGSFSSFPGTRARSMAGAFTAVADDPSAVWYNPAGIADDEHDLVMEYAQATTIDEKDGPLDGSQISWFAGGSLNTRFGDLGLFFYSPYTPKYWAADTGLQNTAWGHVHEIMRVFSLPYAVALFDGHLKLGLSLEYVDIDVGDSGLYLRDAYGIIHPYELKDDSGDAFSGSAGMLCDLVDSGKSRLTVGLTWRLGSSTDIGSEAVSDLDTTQAAGDLFFEKPAGYDAGLAYKRKFSPHESLLFSLQYGSADWGGAMADGGSLSEATYALGMEYQLTNKNAVLKVKSLRLGYYLSGMSGGPSTFGNPDVSGMTWGAGFTVGDISSAPNRCDRLRVDIGQEFRTQNNPGNGETAMLTSITLNWAI